MAKLGFGTLGSLAFVMLSLPNCGGNTEIDANSGTGGLRSSVGTSGSNPGGTGGLVMGSGGNLSAGGAYATGGGAGVICSGISQCTSDLGVMCQCNGGLYSCFTASFGGSPSTGGQTAVPTGCAPGAPCSGLGFCVSVFAGPYTNCQCNGGVYSCDLNVGGSPSTGGQTAVPTGCSQGSDCTGLGQCQQNSPPYDRCQCNGGKYSCVTGTTSTGGQAGVGGATGCNQGATCTGIGQCATPPAPYTRCQCNGGLYSCV